MVTVKVMPVISMMTMTAILTQLKFQLAVIH